MTSTTQSAGAAPAAKAPLAAPAAATVSVVVALVVIAAGVVAGRDALIGIGAVAGSPWIATGLRYTDGLTAQSWMLPAGIVVTVLGLLLFIAAVKPRRRTHRPTRTPNTWIATRDIKRIARGAALSLTGVTEVAVGGSARTLVLTITPVPGYDTKALDDAVRAGVTKTLEPLANPPRLKTRVKERDAS